MERPVTFSSDLGDRIQARMATGEPLVSICRDDSMPTLGTAMNWLNDPQDQRFGNVVRTAFRARLADREAMD